jgi:ABC-type multidrug transport system ATPase subunit
MAGQPIESRECEMSDTAAITVDQHEDATVPTTWMPGAPVATHVDGGGGPTPIELEPVITLEAVSHQRGDVTVLQDVDLSLVPGHLVALAGPSGAGKTTLLTVLAGLVEPTAGRVIHRRDDTSAGSGGALGYVPQDDIVPLDLTVDRVVESAAALVLPNSPEQRRRRVDEVIAAMGLTHRRRAVVRHLSGGERKRVSIAVELLTAPSLFFLDEPTSGLDPAASRGLLDRLRGLASDGSTVVLTTHSPVDIDRCELVVFVATGGSVAFIGSPDQARLHFGVDDLADVYPMLVAPPDREVPTSVAARPGPVASTPPTPVLGRPTTSFGRQWWALTRRSAAQLVRSRLTLAILLGSPLLVTLMMATLFPSGGLDGTERSLTAVQESYWICFASFFFGLTYGLLQVVTEMPIVRRDRLSGVRTTAYVAAKVAVLVPVLLVVNVSMLATLRVTDRLPALDPATWMQLGVTASLISVAALATGLLASAAVGDTTQATLALPMICFPQVLFAGILVPRSDMTTVGRLMSDVLVTRWGFESIGNAVGLGGREGSGPDPFATTFSATVARGWIVLGMIAITMIAGTVLVLRHRSMLADAR